MNKIAEAVEKYDVQFVCSMLYDKLPQVLRKALFLSYST